MKKKHANQVFQMQQRSENRFRVAGALVDSRFKSMFIARFVFTADFCRFSILRCFVQQKKKTVSDEAKKKKKEL